MEMKAVPLALVHNGRVVPVLAVADSAGGVLVPVYPATVPKKKPPVLGMVPARWIGICKLASNINDIGDAARVARELAATRMRALGEAVAYAEEQHAARVYAEEQEERALYKAYGRKF